LASADYRSFRDVRSRELIGVPEMIGRDPIVPDLAYGVPLVRAPKPPSPGLHAVIGVNPMCYARPRTWPVPDADRYARHVRDMAEMVVRGVANGHEVVLFSTTLADRKAVEDVKLQVADRLGPDEHARVRAPVVAGVSELMEVLASVDVVVSARLHGVLLSHVAGRPVLALAHERKVATLMADMNQSRFCLGIDDFEVSTGWRLMGDLLHGSERLSACILEAVADCRHRVDEQYDRIFGTDRG
jgi:polysaccharide pyruvyl transferase WcaK-like protein